MINQAQTKERKAAARPCNVEKASGKTPVTQLSPRILAAVAQEMLLNKKTAAYEILDFVEGSMIIFKNQF